MRKRLGLITGLLLALSILPVVAQETDAPRLRILVTNDDGYEAPGLVALAETLAEVADVTVVAPYSQQSGTGHGITSTREPVLTRRLRDRDGVAWHALEARPATCVRVGIEAIMDPPPDLVVSGINTGSNLGLVSFYSGTVGAAREAAIAGLPAIAVSLDNYSESDFRAGAKVVRDLILKLQSEREIKKGLLLNVNLPRGIGTRFNGIRVTRQSLQPTVVKYEPRETPYRYKYYWGNYEELKASGEPVESDVRALREGFVSVTPLQLDQTDRKEMKALRKALR